MKASVAICAVLAAAIVCSGCGPTDEEAARAILFVMPLVMGAAFGLTFLLLWLWRKVRPELSMNIKPVLISLAVLGTAAGLSFVGVTPREPGEDSASSASAVQSIVDTSMPALMIFGTSFITILLVVWRVWLAVRPRTAFTWAFLPVLIFMLAPCPLMALGLTDGWLDNCLLVVWGIPGYNGLVTGPILGALLIEVAIRIRLARTKGRSSEQLR